MRTRLSKQPPDQHEFQQLLKTFSLCALNCWRRAGTQAQTFLPATGQRGTQIDFILTRLSQADGLARTCAPTWLPFVEDSGMRHLPLLGSIPMPSLPKRSRNTSPQLSLASVRQTLRTHPDLALAYATKAAQFLKDSTPDTISSKLQEAWLQCKPPPCTQPAGPGAHTQATFGSSDVPDGSFFPGPRMTPIHGLWNPTSDPRLRPLNKRASSLNKTGSCVSSPKRSKLLIGVLLLYIRWCVNSPPKALESPSSSETQPGHLFPPNRKLKA